MFENRAFCEGKRGISLPVRQGQRGARRVERGSAAAAELVAVQRPFVPKAVDSGLLLVKYTLRRRLAQPWRGRHEPRRLDCAAKCRNYSVWAGPGLSRGCLVPVASG